MGDSIGRGRRFRVTLWADSDGAVSRRRGDRIRNRLRPVVVALEDRRLPSTFHVTSTADDGSVGTLRWAVQQSDAATSPSAIDFQLGNAPATITLSHGQLELSNTAEPATITGPGAGLLGINGNNANTVFRIDPQVTASLSGLTITGASSAAIGGGVYNAGKATLTNCIITGNTSGYGGGLLSDGNLALLTLDHCTISGNSASIEGGGLWSSGTTTLTGCTISDNTSGDIGGGLNNRNGTLTMTGCIVTGNFARTAGGGVYNQATATLDRCTISGNSAQHGGGLDTGISADSRLDRCTISGNSAQHGGGIANGSTLGITNSTISGNLAVSAGGLDNASVVDIRATATILNCTITGNSAADFAGGINNGDANDGNSLLTLTACTISGNSAPRGGGVYNQLGSQDQPHATLTDTIVAGNTGDGGAPSDVSGQSAGNVAGSFNLIGPGGSGGIHGGVQGNIVLNSVAGLGLAPLGDYGGPTQTIALLPGSPALNAGTAVAGLTTDQRGEPLDVPVHIGAFQSQGFLLTAAADATPQSTLTGEAFANPLTVTVVARNPAEPVVGGVMSFTVTPADHSGAGAVLSAPTSIIGAGHQAEVTATANDIVGTYLVTGSTVDGITSARIILTNLPNNEVALNFTGLIDRSVLFGTDTVTFTGTLANGQQAPPPGETVGITLGGGTHQAVIGPGGSFSTTFDIAGLTAAGSPYTITFHYSSDGTFASAQTTTMMTVRRVTPTVSVADDGGTFGNTAFPATVGVEGVSGVAGPSLEGVAPSLAYYSGTFTSAGQLAGLTPLAGAPRQAGDYTVVANFPGSADYAASQSAPVSFTIGRATATIALEASVDSTVFGQPITFVATVGGAGALGGSVTIFDGSTPLGTVALDGSGRAGLTVTSLLTGSHSITASYSGDPNHVGGVSGSATESVARASTRVMLVRHPVFRRQKLASVGFAVQIVPLSPGAGAPSGTVKFLHKKKALGSVVLSGGSATLTTRTVGLSRRPITIVYGGDADFEPIVTTTRAAPG